MTDHYRATRAAPSAGRAVIDKPRSVRAVTRGSLVVP